MRWYMKLLIIAGLGWSGYWFVGAKGQEQLFDNWLETNRANGWIANSTDMRVTGFPNRFDTIITALDLRGPSGNWGWQAERFQVFALSYKPNHIILSWPGKQVITNSEGSLTLEGTKMRGSIELAANSDLTLERLRAEATDLIGISSLGWETRARTATLAFFQDSERDNRYRLGFDLGDVTIPQEYMTAVAQAGQSSGVISRVLISANIDFENAINRDTLNTGLPQWNALEIEKVELNWGRANLSMTGQLSAGYNGYINGNMNFSVENWQILWTAYKQITVLSPAELALIESALSGLSQGNILEFSLRFNNGKAYIGPFAIGNAPINPFYLP